MPLRNLQLVWLAVAEAAAADMSFSDRSSLLEAALREQFGNDTDGCQRFWLQDVFPGYVIARSRDDGSLYQIGYSISGSTVKMGDAQEVETAYVPVAEDAAFVLEADAAGLDDCIYPVVVMKAGWAGGTVNGAALPHYYTPDLVSQVAEAVASAKFGRHHPKEGFGEDDPDRIAGWYSDGVFVGSEARAKLNLLKSETGLRAKLSAAREAKKLDMFGLSILATIGFEASVVEGRKCLKGVKLGKLYSVDQVSEAGAGGRFLQEMRVAASADVSAEISAAQSAAIKTGSPVHPARHNSGEGRTGDGLMNKLMMLRVLEALRNRDLALYNTLLGELTAAGEDAAKCEAVMLKVTEALSAQPAADATQLAQAQEVLAQLPEPAKKLVRRAFERNIGTKDDLDAEIVAVRESFAAASTIGRINERGFIPVGRDTADKMQIAFDRMLGVKEADATVPAFKGLRAAYIEITGDREFKSFHGGGGFFSRVAEAVVSADFPNILLNSMTKKLLQDYAELGMDGLDMLYTKSDVDNYLLQDRVRDGYFPELSPVAEGGPYTEIGYPTDERVNYAVSNYGNLLTITEQTIRNDNLGAIARFPGKLARAGRKTLKSFISNFFINNSVYMADAVNWFDPTHNNLGSVAFSYDALVTAEIALFQQTEKNSGEQLGLPLQWLMIPIQLKAQAIAINQTDTAGSNGFYQRFGANNERIVINEKLTDDNDWYYGTLPENAPFIEIGFLDGLEQPQIFLANNPTVGTMFTNDELQYKVKHVFGGNIIDYRGVGKNVVAG
jgi:hypothetical protein